MKISVSSYSFQQYIRNGQLTQLSCVQKAHEMGFEAIEFIDLDADTHEARCALARRIREEADRLGMTVNAYTVGANLFGDSEEANDAEVERLCRQLDVAKLLGASVMRHDVCYRLGKTGASRSFDLMLPTIAKNARRVTEYGASIGIRTCSENHGFIAQDSDRVERLFNAVAHDNYGILVDVGNFLCVDEDPIQAVSRLAPYAIHVHVKDFKYNDTKTGIQTRGCRYISGTAVGEGVVPVGQCLAILARAGYDGFVSIEYEGADDCIEGISRGLSTLRGIL